MSYTISKVAVTPETAVSLSALAIWCFAAQFSGSNTKEDMDNYLRESLSVTAMTSEQGDPDNTFLWAMSDESKRAIGYAKYRTGSSEACVKGPNPIELERLYVDPDNIGAGVGKALLDKVVQFTKDEGFSTLWLGVWEENPRSIKFYVREGFLDVGTHDFVLGGDVQNDRIMERRIS